MSSSGKTASSSANETKGWSRTNNAVRSVVSHPLALPLVLCLGFFDTVDSTDHLTRDEFMSYLQSLQSQPETISTNDVPRNRLLDMAWLVHDLKFTTTVKTVFSTFDLITLHKNLIAGIKGWMSGTGTDGNEKALVDCIHNTFRTCLPVNQNQETADSAANSLLLFQSEGGVKLPKSKTSSKTTTCRYDFLGVRYEPGSRSCTPILLFEFGLENSKWWRKLDQACIYLDLLTSLPEDINPIRENGATIHPLCEKPMLLSTVTFDKKTGAFKIAHFLCWRLQVASAKTTSQEKIETMPQISKKVKVSKKYAKGYEMILLWRAIWTPEGEITDPMPVQGENIDKPELNEFAKAFVAIFFAMQCLKDWQMNECIENFLVLGPNCCKVKNGSTPVVLRSYDTRLRQTSRSPNVYLNAKVMSQYDEALKQESSLLTIGRPLLYMGKRTTAAENQDVRNFGYTIDMEDITEEMQQNWLWDNCGKLQLIETAFVKSHEPNAHEAKQPADFIPIINHLLHMHDQGFVHGDIRAFNMVFNGMHGKLIDFDFGGEVGKTRYPPGYKSTLPDSIRCGQALKPIEKCHDWYALGKVIFVFHKFIEPGKLSEQDKIRLIFEKSEISDKLDYLHLEDGISEASISELVTDLKDLLKKLDSNGWTCEACNELYFYYHKRNMDGIDPATGSPKL